MTSSDSNGPSGLDSGPGLDVYVPGPGEGLDPDRPLTPAEQAAVGRQGAYLGWQRNHYRQ